MFHIAFAQTKIDKHICKSIKANPNTDGLIEISKVEYVSKTTKEKVELVNIILEDLIKTIKFLKTELKLDTNRDIWLLFTLFLK